MACHVNDVVNTTQDAEIAVGGLDGAIAGEIGPVPPIFTILVLAKLLIVGLNITLWLTPNRLKNARPRISNTDIAGLSAACFDLASLLIVNNREYAQNARAAT